MQEFNLVLARERGGGGRTQQPVHAEHTPLVVVESVDDCYAPAYFIYWIHRKSSMLYCTVKNLTTTSHTTATKNITLCARASDNARHVRNMRSEIIIPSE